ncbi:MAG: hypothetical protein KDK65_00390 [Chlamydiia bacterium]|nr:hypothetical protein [Chlamydiia bacterium]
MGAQGFNGIGFDPDIDYRDRVPFLINTQEDTFSASQSALENFAGGTTELEEYFSEYFKLDLSTRLPLNFDELVATLQEFKQLAVPSDITTIPGYASLRQAFLDEFKAALNFDADWMTLLNPPAGTVPPTNEDEAFDLVFQSFIRRYDFPSSREFGPRITDVNGVDVTVPPIQEFFSQYRTFLTKLAYIEAAGAGGPDTIFQMVFQAYFPFDQDAFDLRVIETYTDALEENGFFLPSQSYGDFLTKIADAYGTGISGASSTTITSKNPGRHFDNVRVINRIILLLIELIDTTQRVATVQAQRLGFFTSWQRAYTDLLGQVRTFVEDGPEKDVGNNSRRQQLNDANQVYTTSLQSRRQVVSDDAKAQQSSVNASQDAVQQQSSAVTSFLQQLSSLLGAIYR